MKRIFTFVLTAAAAICLTACSVANVGSSSRKNSLGCGFSADVSITLNRLEAEGAVKRFGEGTWEIEFSEPNTLSGVKLEYEGIAPRLTVTVSNVATSVPIKDVVYSIENEQVLYDEGDTIRVKASFDEENAVANAYAIEAGPDGYVKDFTVSGVDRYVTDASEIPQEFLDELKEYGATLFGTNPGDANEYGLRIFTATGAMYSTSGGEYTFAWRTPSYISSYFTCLNDEHRADPGQQFNDIKVVYDTGIAQSDGKAVAAEAVVVFKDLIKKADGTISIDKESGHIVSASNKDSDIKQLVKAKDDEVYTSTKLEQ